MVKGGHTRFTHDTAASKRVQLLLLFFFQKCASSFFFRTRALSLSLQNACNRFLEIGKTFRPTFPSSELQCSPHGDPRNMCANTGIDY